MQGILTANTVARAFEFVRPCIELTLRSGVTRRRDLVVVANAVEIINPMTEGKSFEDNCYLVHEFGDPAKYEWPYKKIALSKAEISVRTGLPTTKVAPQYLLDDDTVNSGSAVIDGIVVACSGVEGFYDEMFSYWLAAAIQAEAKRYFTDLREAKVDFVP
ncbi:MAG TPA: hypothetical protein VHD55_01590 [Candidatus Paceibacterota bacterium]|nr:hypothetical protein [Candidatus Paceibacterota bacterium]